MSRTYNIEKQPDGRRKIGVGPNFFGSFGGELAIFYADQLPGQHTSGWSIDVDLLEMLDEEGIKEIWVDRDGTFYGAFLDRIREAGVPVCDQEKHSQLCLAFDEWDWWEWEPASEGDE